jgi:BMFP domain-containing protein YqiC
MMDLRIIDELARRLGEALPPGLAQGKQEMENRFRTVLTAAFERMNLVGREEFEARSRLLEETRARLQELEKRLAELESG